MKARLKKKQQHRAERGERSCQTSQRTSFISSMYSVECPPPLPTPPLHSTPVVDNPLLPYRNPNSFSLSVHIPLSRIMSGARYNLSHGDPSQGDHATLIANWVEERALRNATGHTRHSELAVEKVVDMGTFQRCVAHTDDQQRSTSLYKEEFKEHTIDPHASKVRVAV